MCLRIVCTHFLCWNNPKDHNLNNEASNCTLGTNRNVIRTTRFGPATKPVPTYVTGTPSLVDCAGIPTTALLRPMVSCHSCKAASTVFVLTAIKQLHGSRESVKQWPKERDPNQPADPLKPGGYYKYHML
jgi:hypothetical protein